ncbi:MATE family efflux transporter [Nitratidesulfovibrio liaohensis]|uniref:Multidrug-efflux transporter n=1 Tax=Nitratidesulfovibrio liaohensis TaxID=2604158 RepID=A0ABY9R5L5_9BACT|nr:MATE family efflux transporter [Nitratidesulfovibrio liaohensis]WMW66601.1 MATE family efflux transporter [Nitratidesulfovibrio liaohensis]
MSQHARPQGDDASYGGIWRLTWPQMLMMLFHFLIGFTDVWVAGRIHADVQAAIGLVSQCLFFLLVVAVAGASAGVAAISQALGAGLLPRARRYVGMVLVGGCSVGVGIMLLGFATSESFLRLLQVPEQIMPVTAYFWKVYLLGLPANYLFTITGAVFRARKRMIAPLLSMVAVCAVNAVADLGFGLGLWGLPAYGYAGVAWATFASVTAGAVLNVGMLVRDRELLQRSSFPPLRWMRRGAPYLFRVAAPAAGLQIMWNLGYLVLFSIAASLPVDSVVALAGMTAGMRVESIIFLPAFAFNMTASVLVGHLLGAGRKPEAVRVSLRLLGIGCASMTVFAALLWPWTADIAAWLAPEPAVAVQVVSYLRYNLVSIPFTVASMTLGGVMTGAGATLYSFLVYGSATWFVRLPLAWVMGHVVWRDAAGIFLAMFVSQVFQSSVMLWLFYTHDWSRFSMIRRNGRKAASQGAASHDRQ